MNMLPMYDKFLGEISSDFMDVGGVKTAYYFYQGDSNKTILLIHGIGGDFHGMIPLAYYLKMTRIWCLLTCLLTAEVN